MAMLKDFSAGYYIGQLYVAPYDGDRAVMDHDQHVEVNEQVYTTGEILERLDHPLVMKVDQSHFPVFATNDIPTGTLGLPEDILKATQVEQPPTLKEVLVAKAGWAAQLLEWYTPYTIQEPDFT